MKIISFKDIIENLLCSSNQMQTRLRVEKIKCYFYIFTYFLEILIVIMLGFCRKERKKNDKKEGRKEKKRKGGRKKRKMSEERKKERKKNI